MLGLDPHDARSRHRVRRRIRRRVFDSDQPVTRPELTVCLLRAKQRLRPGLAAFPRDYSRTRRGQARTNDGNLTGEIRQLDPYRGERFRVSLMTMLSGNDRADAPEALRTKASTLTP
jgi:hypothetical protein